MLFKTGEEYTKSDIYQVLNVPVNKQKGAWNTGYTRYEGRFYLFVNLGTPGRTGHDYKNYWNGDELVWFGKNLSRLNNPIIQSLLTAENVLLFNRWDNRSPFTFEGLLEPINSYDEQPVKIIWKMKTQGIGPLENPQEVQSHFIEGKSKSVYVNIFERNVYARRECISYYGPTCSVCEFDFEKTYGEIGKDFIHVHHLLPISEVGKEYLLNPIKDLIPVCPNCHAMLHRRSPPYSIDELRALIHQGPN